MTTCHSDCKHCRDADARSTIAIAAAALALLVTFASWAGNVADSGDLREKIRLAITKEYESRNNIMVLQKNQESLHARLKMLEKEINHE